MSKTSIILESKMARKTLWYWQSLILFFATLVGNVPSHHFRRAIYRHLLGMKLGHHSTIHWRCRLRHPKGIEIGNHSIIGNDSFLDGRKGLRIGNCVVTGSEVAIYTLQHDIDDPYFVAVGGKVIIDDYAYLGPRAMILPSVRIGYGSVIMAGAIVTKDVPDFAVVGGIPAKFIRERARDLRYKPVYAKPFQ